MEKTIKNLLSIVADFLPGIKTYVFLGVMSLMGACEVTSYIMGDPYSFPEGAWASVMAAAGFSYKLGQDRENPDSEVGTPRNKSLGKTPKVK